MTAKPKARLDFDKSGQVRVSATNNSAGQSADQLAPAQDKEDSVGARVDNLPFGGRNVAPEVSVAAVPAPTAPPQAVGIRSGENAVRNELADNKGGNLGGTIFDPSGAAIVNAKVTVSGAAGDKVVTSDPAGRFSFSVAPGAYSVKAEAAGFKTTEIKQVAVLNNSDAALQLRLEPGTASESVEVSGAAPAPEATAPDATGASAGYVVQQRASEEFSVQGNSAQASLQKATPAASGVARPLRWTISPLGAVERSGDRGRTWQLIKVAGDTTFRALSAAGGNVWVGGSAGALFHSSDSGNSWIKINPVAGGKKLDQDIIRVDFSGELTGAVNTANGEVWSTTDGGQTWRLK